MRANKNIAETQLFPTDKGGSYVKDISWPTVCAIGQLASHDWNCLGGKYIQQRGFPINFRHSPKADTISRQPHLEMHMGMISSPPYPICIDTSQQGLCHVCYLFRYMHGLFSGHIRLAHSTILGVFSVAHHSLFGWCLHLLCFNKSPRWRLVHTNACHPLGLLLHPVAIR